ncbi:hypothetical protein R1sor_011649 [Riccia sorocarpa]|uniref:Uncharacterized protein n=1 Tax=Riccia sorocarpa TaxID=122646 RepID=A0ABD3I1G9_9MARC
MAGVDKSDQAMQRIFNKEGVTKAPTVTGKMTPEERLGLVSKNCDSGPGHPEQTRSFYKDKPNTTTPTSTNINNTSANK